MYTELSGNFAQCDDEQKEIIFEILSQTPSKNEIIQAMAIAHQDTCVSTGILYWNFFVKLETRSDLCKAFIQKVPDTHNAHHAIGECVHAMIMKM